MEDFSEIGTTSQLSEVFGEEFADAQVKAKTSSVPETEERVFQPFLEVNGVSKVFRKGLSRFTGKGNGVVALDNVSLTVGKGEIFGVLGPNGAGKSTLIKVITGLVIPDEGEVALEGLHFRRDKEKFMSKVGAQIETPVFFNKQSGWWNLKYLADLQGGLPEQRIKDIVEIVGLSGRIKSRVGTYSMGMRQRLGIAQAIMHKPQLLVLDEPINGLDPDGIAQVRDLIRQLRDDYGTTVLFSSHILGEMQTLCDRVAFLSKGRLVAVKTKNEIERGTGDTCILSVVCDEPNRAAALIQQKFGYRTKVQGMTLYVEVKGGNTAEINKNLIENSISVVSFNVKTRTLEELYKELTR